jgi:hypothetical protein
VVTRIDRLARSPLPGGYHPPLLGAYAMLTNWQLKRTATIDDPTPTEV